jgi:hypothetical protein
MSYNRDNAGAAALEFARQLDGKPYVYGGTWPQSGGTDCDGLVTWAYAQVGVHLIRPTETTYKEYPIGNSVPYEVGDLIFIPGAPIDPNPGHVMMYVGPGLVFQAEETGTLIGQFPYDTDNFEFRTRPALALPLPPKPTTNPTAAQLTKAGLVLLTTKAQVNLAVANKWTVFYWGGLMFRPDVNLNIAANRLYANKNYRKHR